MDTKNNRPPSTEASSLNLFGLQLSNSKSKSSDKFKSISTPSFTWVVLDDEEILEGDCNQQRRDLFQGHVIKTESSKGLQWYEAKQAIHILNGTREDLKQNQQNKAVTPLPLILMTPPKGTCRHYWKKGSCRMGDDCRFGHPPRSELPPVPRRKYRQQVSNGGRFRQFREWIIKTFDVADLQKGSGVLCVADGKGILSFELLNIHNIPTTVIDPRPLSLERNVKLWYRGLYHKKTYTTNIIRYVPEKKKEEKPSLPLHLRAFFLPQLWNSLLRKKNLSKNASVQDLEDLEVLEKKIFSDNLIKAEQTVWTKQGLQPQINTQEQDFEEEEEMKEVNEVVQGTFTILSTAANTITAKLSS